MDMEKEAKHYGKRIVYIRASSIYNDSRATKEINALYEAGYRVTVLGWNRDGKGIDKCKTLFANKNIRVELFNNNAENGIGGKNSYKLIVWTAWLRVQLHKLKGEIDIIHMCDFDSAIGAFHYARKHTIKTVYDIYDYYADAHNIPGFMIKTIMNAENNIINRSDLVIICTEERVRQIKDTNPRKLIVIHNTPEIVQDNKSIH